MKNMRNLFLATFLFLFFADIVANPVLSPNPQQLISGGKNITLPASYTIEGISEADPVAVAELQKYFPSVKEKSEFKIIIGENGDKSIKPYIKKIPTKKEAYFLQINSNKIIIAGADPRGTFYGVQTLIQLLNNGELPEVTISDYPDVPFRGVVEGFYGNPWSYEDRLRQIEFYGKNKLNTYIYGPKDDPYHSSPHWRDAYPEKEAQKIKGLINKSLESKVDFVWAIHPGKDIQWNDADRDAVLYKFEWMYELGVRAFAVFFDDISGVGTNAENQASLLNYLDDHFITKKEGITQFIMCPTEYNKRWANPAKGYLKTLGEKLHPSIQIMWTGDNVMSEIREETLLWINEQIGRPPYIWWNFPVSDYVRDHLLMGRVYGNDKQIENQLSGFVSNPMERAEASKIAIYSVADYTWNLKAFDSNRSWKQATQNLMPVSWESLYKFVEHNSDMGNGHAYRREESVQIKPVMDRILASINKGGYNPSDLRIVKEEFNEIMESANYLFASHDNETLIKEIEPWIYQFKNMGETGLALMELLSAYEAGDPGTFKKKYDYVRTLRIINYNIDHTYNQNPYQPGVKTGSLVIWPFINSMFHYLTEVYNKQYNIQLDPVLFYSPYQFATTVERLKEVVLQSKLKQISLPPVNEIVKWNKGEYIRIKLDKEYPLDFLKLNILSDQDHSWLGVKISKDGIVWEVITFPEGKNAVEIKLQSKRAKYIHIINTKEDIELNFKGLTLGLK